MDEILRELSKPFHPSHITWKPGATNRDKTSALAMAYADLRVYQNRLDEVCGMNWGVNYTPWGDRIVCHLTINGVTRSSTGEPDSQSEKSEIAGTASEAQAFKRACAMFGLGRYLYNLPTIWADYDSNSRKFTEAGQARLNGVIAQHYKRHREDEPQPEPVAQPVQPVSNGNGRKTEPVEETAKLWASDPLILIRSNTDYQFSGPAEAIGWGNATGVFDDYRHAQNAYEEVKRDKKPRSPAEMWALWLGEVASRINETQKQAA